MKKILHMLIGITLLSVDKNDTKSVINLANKNHILLLDTYTVQNIAFFKIYSKEESCFLKILSSEKIEFTINRKRGIKRLIKKYKHRIGIWAGMIVLFAVLYISPLFIWEINISGIDKLSEEYVTSVLSNEGVRIGSFQPHINRKRTYMNIISSNPDISWISVNFIGSSANIEVIERDYTEIAEISADATNIIASKDGQISELKILNGKCIVKSGDIVKKGDILISGVYDSGMKGTKYVNASGEVYANVSDVFYTEIPLKQVKKEYINEIVVERDINIFGKSIKIYKNYSNFDGNYDTIIKECNFKKSNMKDLPISSSDTVAMIYSEKEIIYSVEDALNVARNQFFSFIDTDTDYRDIISYDESYEIKDNALLYSAEINAIENIAQPSKINIE